MFDWTGRLLWPGGVSPSHRKGLPPVDYCPLGNDQYLLATRLFYAHWSHKKVHIHCDNEAVITVLRSGKTHDAFLAACAWNIWYTTAIHNIDVQFSHIREVENTVADLLSRWQGSPQQKQILHSHIKTPKWLAVSKDMLDNNPHLQSSCGILNPSLVVTFPVGLVYICYSEFV